MAVLVVQLVGQCVRTRAIETFGHSFYCHMAQPKIMVYGANGFTARLFLHKLAALPCDVILAGRNKADIAALAQQHGYRHRIFGLDDANVVDKHLADIALLLNCALDRLPKRRYHLQKVPSKIAVTILILPVRFVFLKRFNRMHDDARGNNVCLIACTALIGQLDNPVD